MEKVFFGGEEGIGMVGGGGCGGRVFFLCIASAGMRREVGS